ncbi:MAG: hypothetical protein PHU93_00065 [Candidatus Gracilibacteria bacterium]|nr:hypothetical protein [Candidatus Gracilibacteria bacterium]
MTQIDPTDITTSPSTGDDGTSGTSNPPAVKKPENEIFYDLASIHPMSEFTEVHFIDLLEHSLSLSVAEKKRVVDAIPTLSQFQVDELHKVFEDEREEFKKLLAKEGEVIRDLVIKAKEGWDQLRSIYVDEQREYEKQNADNDKMNELKNLLDETSDS